MSLPTKHNKVLNYIKNDTAAISYLNERSKKVQKVRLEIGERLISPDVNSLIFDILKQNYNISIMDLSSSDMASKIILKVEDSLRDVSLSLSQTYVRRDDFNLKKLNKDKKPNCVLLFSNVINNHLYCELMYKDEKHPFWSKKSNVSYYGTSLAFLFEFDKNNKIQKVYHGKIHYN